jgi:enoyl-CoA hydratase/carnithine racemase
MSSMFWDKDGGVARLVMDDGKNEHNPGFIEMILARLDEIEADEAVTAVVLTSGDEKNFSQGIDLAWIGPCFSDPARHGEVRDFLHGLNRIFARLLTYPVPVIAAINGHAFGDGAIMACACDFRLMRSDRGFFCFPEVDINIPFLPGMLAVVQKAFPGPFLNEVYLTGRRLGAEELAAQGVAVKASPDAEALQADALEFARGFQKDRPVFGEIKRRKHQHILDIFERDDAPLIESLQVMMM